MNKDIDELITIIKGGMEYFMPCYRLDEITCNKIISALEELKVYNKALILACKELSFRDCKEKHISSPITVRYKQEFLQEAREQSDD